MKTRILAILVVGLLGGTIVPNEFVPNSITLSQGTTGPTLSPYPILFWWSQGPGRSTDKWSNIEVISSYDQAKMSIPSSTELISSSATFVPDYFNVQLPTFYTSQTKNPGIFEMKIPKAPKDQTKNFTYVFSCNANKVCQLKKQK